MSHLSKEFINFMECNQGCTFIDINRWAMKFAPVGYKGALDQELEELINSYIESNIIATTKIQVKNKDDVIESVVLYYYRRPSMWNFNPSCAPTYRHSVDQYIVRRDMGALDSRIQELIKLEKMTKEGTEEIKAVSELSSKLWGIISQWY